MNTNTIGSRYPAKPVRKETIQVSRQAEADEVITLFNAFVSEARKEMRKRTRLTVQGRISEIDCDQVTFLGEKFSVTINFTEGIAV